MFEAWAVCLRALARSAVVRTAVALLEGAAPAAPLFVQVSKANHGTGTGAAGAAPASNPKVWV